MKLSFHGGVNEIGGNKFLLEDDDTKIFLDFGMSFNSYGEYFKEYLKPRLSCGMGDFVSRTHEDFIYAPIHGAR